MLTESYLLINIHKYIHTYLHTYTHAYVRTYTHTHTHTHTYTHTVVQAEFRGQDNLNTVCGTLCKVHDIQQGSFCRRIFALHLGRFPVLTSADRPIILMNFFFAYVRPDKHNSNRSDRLDFLKILPSFIILPFGM
jgi:hypothetical protein